MTDARTILQKFFGYTTFRQGQADVVSALLSGRDVLCVMPTGAGKSLCYQIPALAMDGIALVISPLISLMKDQVRALREAGVDAAYINSSLSYGQYVRVLQNTQAGMYKILYVAPERLENNDFRSLCANMHISLIAVDEAHCVSQWGQDFRPSYLGILDFVNQLENRPILAAFTATAAAQVREDIRSLLQLKSPHECITGFDRPNLYFGVQQPENKKSALLSLAEQFKDRVGIIYCMSRKTVEDVCDFLRSNGYNATRYHAGLSDNERRLNQDDFLYDRATVMVATSAFGMGIDKSNVSFVIHYNMPPDLESYYQEAGRAGRDGSAADCILLFSPGDFYTNRSLLTHQESNPDIMPEQQAILLERSMKRLSDMYEYGSATDCLRGRILRYFGETGTDNCGNCSNCLAEMIDVDVTIDAQKILSCIVRSGEHYGANTISAILQGSKNEKLRESGLDKLTTWGIMKEKTPVYIKRVTEHLLSAGMLTAVGDFGVLKLTENSKSVLRGTEKVLMKLPEDIRIEKSQKETKRKTRVKSSSASAAVHNDLFERLRELRTQLARQEEVPPYIVASNALLEEISIAVPENRERMLQIHGMGEAKFEKYGQAFLNVVINWKHTNSPSSAKLPDSSTVPAEHVLEISYTDEYFTPPPYSDEDAPPEDSFFNQLPPDDLTFATPFDVNIPQQVKTESPEAVSVARDPASNNDKTKEFCINKSEIPWTDEEDDQLRKEIAEHMTLLQISRRHGRQAFSIFTRMQKLGLT